PDGRVEAEPEERQKRRKALGLDRAAPDIAPPRGEEGAPVDYASAKGGVGLHRVIASEAKQSIFPPMLKDGLIRRYASRNDKWLGTLP
ncbi:hypothetical protein, partial [Enterobacter hormaechei]|uniref:hypothetical protein n=1 Tax=Enterobacter hormaechei TaxID=158836 RepID=UPI0013D3D200